MNLPANKALLAACTLCASLLAGCYHVPYCEEPMMVDCPVVCSPATPPVEMLPAPKSESAHVVSGEANPTPTPLVINSVDSKRSSCGCAYTRQSPYVGKFQTSPASDGIASPGAVSNSLTSTEMPIPHDVVSPKRIMSSPLPLPPGSESDFNAHSSSAGAPWIQSKKMIKVDTAGELPAAKAPGNDFSTGNEPLPWAGDALPEPIVLPAPAMPKRSSSVRAMAAPQLAYNDAPAASAAAAEQEPPTAFLRPTTSGKTYVPARDYAGAESQGHARDYSWLFGQLTYSNIDRCWKIRYASVDETDAFGGSASLIWDSRDIQTDCFKEGQMVRVYGQFQDRASHGRAAAYRVTAIQMEEPASR